MPTTSLARKPVIKHLVAGVDPGATLGDTLRDAVIISMQSDIQVTIMHKNKPFVVNPHEILRLLAIQNPLITGEHLVRGGPSQG